MQHLAWVMSVELCRVGSWLVRHFVAVELLERGNAGLRKRKSEQGEYTMEKAMAVHVPGRPAVGEDVMKFEELDVYRSTERAESAGAEPMDDEVWKGAGAPGPDDSRGAVREATARQTDTAM